MNVVLWLLPAISFPVLAGSFLFFSLLTQWIFHRWLQNRLKDWVRAQVWQTWLGRAITLWFVLLNLPWLWILRWWWKDGVQYSFLVGRAIESMPGKMAWAFSIWLWGSWAVAGVVCGLALAGALGRWGKRRLQAFLKKGESQPPAVSRETPETLVPVVNPIGRREFLQAASSTLVCSPLVVSAYGAYVARESYRLERVRLALPNLPPDIRGTRIVQLTDVHAGVFMDYDRMMKFVNVANALEPDLLVLTGDYIPYSSRFIPLFFSAFQHLRAKHGVFATIGNHDLFTGAVEMLNEGFRANEMKLLVNEQATVRIRGSKLNLMGVTYIPQFTRENLLNLTLDEAMKGMVIRDVPILLSHQPNVFPQAAARQIPLTLSGHTHGGQVKFEFLGEHIAPTRLTTDYPSGLYEIGAAKLYVSRGLGTSGPPMRIGALPEITEITLV
ncbi:MAG: metallophosphoesterase [Blastocatellia bacterium]|nr:metallophosphoesterase [Blastocatellia bacterium]